MATPGPPYAAALSTTPELTVVLGEDGDVSLNRK